MPMHRGQTLGQPKLQDDRGTPTVGDYFETVADFLKGPARQVMMQALPQRRHAGDRSCRVRICLEKHGALYHPARVDVITPESTVALALNVALSAHGATALLNEVSTLNHLARKYRHAFLPTALALTDDKAVRWPMFMAQWFEGFDEFHLSPLPNQGLGIKVWHHPEPFFLSDEQSLDLYRRAAYILTRCYDPVSFEQVFPWHMAAGDFIVAAPSGSLDLRLVTARDYQPLIKGAGADTTGAVLEGLIHFFLHLTLRLRLDRLDGTGDLVWAPAWAVEGAVVGFLEALAETSGHLHSDDLPFALVYALSRLAQHQIENRLGAICDAWTNAAAERPFLSAQIASHAQDLQACLAPFFIDKSTQ